MHGKVWHTRGEPEREPKWVRSGSEVRVAPRKNEVKQQPVWRLVFVDRVVTYRIADCLDELDGRDTLASTGPAVQEHIRIWVFAETSHEGVCEGCRLDWNWPWRAALLKRRHLLTVNAAFAQATTEMPLLPRREARA